MGKPVVPRTEPYVYDGSPEAGRRAYARAHAPYTCGLCGTKQPAGRPHHCMEEKCIEPIVPVVSAKQDARS